MAAVMAATYPDVYAAVGVHPNHAHEERADFIGALRDLSRHPAVVAIGEIGIDHYRLPDDESARATLMARQMDAYRAQLELAVELGLNVEVLIVEVVAKSRRRAPGSRTPGSSSAGGAAGVEP